MIYCRKTLSKENQTAKTVGAKHVLNCTASVHSDEKVPAGGFVISKEIPASTVIETPAPALPRASTAAVAAGRDSGVTFAQDPSAPRRNLVEPPSSMAAGKHLNVMVEEDDVIRLYQSQEPEWVTRKDKCQKFLGK